jgi:osmoprotectant transport system ATP-binding protein
VGRDRGYRSLSFVPAAGLQLDQVRVVRDPAAAAGDGPALVVDADGVPQGWLEPGGGGILHRLGSVFDPETDTMRVALDSALTSPVGLALAVSKGTGRYSGIVRPEQILAQVADARAGGEGDRSTAEHGLVDSVDEAKSGDRSGDGGTRRADATSAGPGQVSRPRLADEPDLLERTPADEILPTRPTEAADEERASESGGR